jgi:hypothetical protein
LVIATKCRTDIAAVEVVDNNKIQVINDQVDVGKEETEKMRSLLMQKINFISPA